MPQLEKQAIGTNEIDEILTLPEMLKIPPRCPNPGLAQAFHLTFAARGNHQRKHRGELCVALARHTHAYDCYSTQTYMKTDAYPPRGC